MGGRGWFLRGKMVAHTPQKREKMGGENYTSEGKHAGENVCIVYDS